MAKILVSGLINIETTLRIEGFPLHYNPVNYPFFGVNSSVSGVGYNVAKALTTLGNRVKFLSLIGQGMAATQVRDALAIDNIATKYVLGTAQDTPQSVILYDRLGNRQIHVDLKNVQELQYPPALFEEAILDCDLLALCNINFSRPLLEKARAAGKLVATDVHTIASLYDTYDRDFMAAADILFLSDEHLPCQPEHFARQIMEHYRPRVLVIGLGAAGALLAVRDDGFNGFFPAVQTRPVVNTIGAGDALFSAFLHAYMQTRNPVEAIQKAIVFASYKIGGTSAAEGFLNAAALDRLYTEVEGRFNR
jgi:sugar/nucleoside kinase (ribokinase family)